MADFWGGFGKGFAPAFETAWESADKQSAAKRKMDLELKKSKNLNMSKAIAAFEKVKQAGGKAELLFPVGTDPKKAGLPSNWVKTASEAELLSVAERATPLVSELQRVRTQTQAREKQMDTLRGAEWTDPISGELRIEEAYLGTYPKGGRRHDNLLLGSGDFAQSLSEPAKQRLANSGGPADELRKEIAYFTGSDMPSFYDLTPQEQAADVTDSGMERLRKMRNGVAGYLDRYGKPLTFDLLKVGEKANLIESIRKNQGKIREGGLSGDDLTKAQNLTRVMRVRLASLVGETEFTVEKLERKIADFDRAEAAGQDMDALVWKTGRTKALARVEDFRKYIKPAKFSNGKYEHQIMVGEGDDRGDLYDKTYFDKVYLPGSKDTFYLDVKDDFRRWMPTFKETIPQFVGGKEVFALNPTGVPRAMIYLPIKKVIRDPNLPAGKLGQPGPPPDVMGSRSYDEFWKERPEMLGTGKMEREKVRAFYDVGPDGDIEAPAVPVPAAPKMKVFEETPDLKKVPRRGEPRAEVDEATKILSAANASDEGAAALNVILGQATAEEIAEINTARFDEKKQLETLRKILERLKGLEK